ncbi:hypothetical protein V1505DRAFT_368432 [Lipomyces doorenjongii]
MEPDLISVASLVDTTLTIGYRSLTMIDMAHRQVAPVVELKLIGVFSNPAHGYDHVASALESYGTILQAEFPRVGTSTIHEDALEVTLALNEKRTLPPRTLPLVSPAPHFFQFSSTVRIRYVSETWCIYCRQTGHCREDCTAMKTPCSHCKSTAPLPSTAQTRVRILRKIFALTLFVP